jgi:UDP-N-acetyl-D-mannosaminuronate dehydrogenase
MAGVYETLPIDVVHFKEYLSLEAHCTFLHVCVPGTIDNFEGTIADYVDKYAPVYVFIHSTLVPGTTRRLNEKLKDTLIAHTPVHGKHHGNRMKSDMLMYPKYVGVPENTTDRAVEEIEEHFAKMGFRTVKVIKNTDTVEWSKVLATTVFGLQIAFAQEVERICDEFGLDYDEVTDFFPIQQDVRGAIYPGFIGGHCVMPNVKIIKGIYESKVLDWMEWSNEEKKKRDGVKVDNRGR